MVNCSGTRSSNSSRSLDKWYESILKNQIKKFLNTLLVLQSNALKLNYPRKAAFLDIFYLLRKSVQNL